MGMVWLSQRPDHKSIEILKEDLEQAVHAKKPSSIPELRLLCKNQIML